MSVWWICLSNWKIKCTKRKICSLFCYVFSVWTLFVYNWGTTNLTCSLFFFTGQQRNSRMTKLKNSTPSLICCHRVNSFVFLYMPCLISSWLWVNGSLYYSLLLHTVQTQRQALRLAFIPTSNLESPTVIWISFTLRGRWHTKGWHASSS